MSKSRNRKWYDYEDDDYESTNNKTKRLHEQRRRDKRLKSALKTRDIDYLKEMED